MGAIPFAQLCGPVNSIILLASYILYLTIGLGAVIAGFIYVGSTGTLGDTGFALIVLGLFFLIVGCVALFGLMKKSGLILCIVELIMLALYFVLFIVAVAAVMLGSGARDPVQRMFDDNWDRIKVQVYGAKPILYEQQCTNGLWGSNPQCITYAGKFKAEQCISIKEKGEQNSLGMYGINCTKFDDLPGVTCPAVKSLCLSCEQQCKKMLIAHSKEKNIAACVVCMILTIFMIGTVCLHCLARNGFYRPNEEAQCCKGLGAQGWIIIITNIVFSGLGITTVILGTVTVRVPVDGQFDMAAESSALWMILFLIGFILTIIPIFQIVLIAIHKTPNYQCDVVVTVLIFVMMLVTVFLGFLSGALVEDINSLYDENYAKYRGELELYDGTYCELTQAECTLVTDDASAKVYPTTSTDRPASMAPISRNELWANQHSALQKVPFENLPPSNFLHSCHSSELCIRCLPAITALKNAGFNMTTQTIRGNKTTGLVQASDNLKANVEIWSEKLFNQTEMNPAAKFALKKCEIALDKMAGGAAMPGWNTFPNPAAKCRRIHFALRFSYQGEIKDEFTGEVLKPAQELDYSAKIYENTQNCSEYLLNMMAKGAGNSGKGCVADSVCRANVIKEFGLVYHYMKESEENFCQMPDSACKAKISFDIAQQMMNVGIVCIIMLVFQLTVIFTTYWGIMTFGLLCLGGGEGDDDDDDDGDDDEEEEEEEAADDDE